MLRLRTFGVKGIEIAYSSAAVGDILCSDLKIVSAANYTISGKTAIGVVFYNSSGELKAVSLTQQGGVTCGGKGIDIPELTNYALPGNAITDTNGTANTTTIISYLGDSTSLAAGYCRAFSTSGRAAGNWDLPAAGELNAMKTNKTTINASLSTVSGTTLSLYYLSSTEYDGNEVWAYNANYDVLQTWPKDDDSAYARPITKITY